MHVQGSLMFPHSAVYKICLLCGKGGGGERESYFYFDSKLLYISSEDGTTHRKLSLYVIFWRYV